MSAGRAQFAQAVHATAHAVVALRAVLRWLDANPAAHIGQLRAEIRRRDADLCQLMRLPPDCVGDELEAAANRDALRTLTDAAAAVAARDWTPLGNDECRDMQRLRDALKAVRHA